MIQTRVLKVLRSALESYEFLFDKNPTCVTSGIPGEIFTNTLTRLLLELRKFLESVRHSHPNKNAVREFDSLLKSTPPNTISSGMKNIDVILISNPTQELKSVFRLLIVPIQTLLFLLLQVMVHLQV